VAGNVLHEVSVRDSRSQKVDYVGDTVTITADTTPTDPPADYEALPAPSTQAVPSSVGMKAVFSGVADTTISLSLLIKQYLQGRLDGLRSFHGSREEGAS
jgi:hypothetical protein